MTTTLNTLQPCGYCGLIHQHKCPLISAIEYHPDGVTVKRVTFFNAVNAPGVVLVPPITREYVARMKDLIKQIEEAEA